MEAPIANLAHHWDLRRVVAGSVLQRSASRTTSAIQSEQGRFVVKVFDDASALGLVHPTERAIDEHLAIFDDFEGRGFGHAPRLLRTRSGARFVRSGGRTLYILEQIVGDRPPDTPATWAAFGRLAARLNAYTDYPYAYGIPVEGTMSELARQAANHPFKREFLRLVGTLEALSDQPVGLIHAEINPANAIMTTDGRIVLLDWDQAGTGPCALEAGYALLTAFLGEDLAFCRDSAVAFYRAYTSDRGMTTGQWEFVFTAALLHALRYLRFGDPVRRWARIEFANERRDELLSTIAEGSKVADKLPR